MSQAAMPSRVLEPSAPETGAAPLRIHVPRPMAVMEPPAASGGIKPFAYLKYRWVTVLFLGGLLAGVLAFAAWNVIPSKYSTYSLVRVFSSDPVINSKEDVRERNDFAIYLKSQAAMIKSNFVLTAALRDPRVASLPMLREQNDPERFLEEELKIEFQEGSEILKIMLSGDDPRAISAIVNSIQDAYFREVVDEEVTRKKNRLKQLEDSINRMQEEVKRRQDQNKQNDLANPIEAIPGLTANLAANQLIRLKEGLAQIENNISHWTSEKAGLEKRLANLAGEIPPPSAEFHEKIDHDPDMQAHKKRIEFLTTRVEFLAKASNDPNLASIVDMRKQIEELKGKREAFKKERLEVYNKAQQATAESKLKADLERAMAGLVQLAVHKKKTEEGIEEYQKSVGMNGPTGDTFQTFPVIDVRERFKIITEMMDKANLLRLEVNAPPRVSDFQRAAVPMKKEMKKQLLGTIMAGLLGFGLVGMGVVLYESRIRRALSLADVQKNVLGPMTGVWPARLGAGNETNEALAEAVEKSRAHLLQQFSGPGAKVVAITSALTEEGKGFLAWQLAQSFTRAGSRTLLIDFDLRAPALHRLLGVENERGVCEVLTGKADLADVVLAQADGLAFLPAGKWAADVRVGLAPERVDALMQWLRRQFDFIVLNTHPLLAVAESLQLCRNADGVLLSVARHESRLPLAARAHEKLAAVAPEAFGLVYQGATTEECLN